MKKLILVFSMFTYDEYKAGISNTNSHIFDWLRNTNPDSRIIFIDFNRFGCINKLKYLIKFVILSKHKNSVNSSLTNKMIKISENIFVYKGWTYSKLFNLIKKSNRNIEIWSFNPFIKKYNIDKAKKYFYTIDDWRQNKIFSKYSYFLDSNYKNIPLEFDKVFVNNKNLKKELYNNNGNIFFIPNGVDTEHYIEFQKTKESIRKQIDEKIPSTNKKIVGYMGVISSERVDYELCEYIIKNNNDLLFIFAGPVLPGFDSQKLQSQYKNVKFIGLVYYKQLPYLFSRFNVCIIPHQLSKFIQSMDSKKLYEYLAAGKPIITTPVSSTENFKEVINITDDKKTFSNYINEAIDNDSEQLILKRQKIARQHDWQLRFSEISNIIND
ncbi:MAG: glycosyltransferase [Candidatus Helarchaeota archaeon]